MNISDVPPAAEQADAEPTEPEAWLTASIPPGEWGSGEDLTDALAHLTFVVTSLLNRVALAEDLSLTQVRLLAILRDHTPTMSQLSQHLGLDKSSMSGLVSRAQKRDLVLRVPDPEDGRTTRVQLAPEGHALSRRLQASVGEALADVTKALTPAQERQLHRLLRLMLPGAQ